MRILVTGATGNIGRHLVNNLLVAGQQVRALTRNPSKAGLPPPVEVIQGDMTMPETLPPALEGVESTYVSPASERFHEFVDLARRAGVRRMVLLSGASAAGDTERDRESWTHPRYRAVEVAVEDSGLAEWTFLRPGPFATNLLWWAPSIRAEGVVRAPYGAAVYPLIHEADIADVAALTLTQDGHVGEKYTLTGPETTSQVDQVAAISNAIGRDIRFEELTEEQWRATVGKFLPPGIVTDLLRYWSETAEDPSTALPVLPTVTRITGRPARTLAQWAADHQHDFS
jgi:uncharacterized protein YbjT (DUF2867 family)